jgi:hypothetical protein
MATAAPAYDDRNVSIGRVFQRAFGAVQTNPVVIVGLALLIGALPALIITILLVQLGLGGANGLQSGFSIGRILGASFFSSMVMMVVSALVQGTMTRATVSACEGRAATFAESFAAAARVLLPLIGLSILYAIAIGLGLVLFLIPGLILLLMWAVAVPSLVVERQGVMAAFRRSAQLTKGSRLKILALFLVFGVAYLALSWLLRLFGLGMYTTGSFGGLTVSDAIGSVIMTTISTVIWGTVQPSLYVELRQAKEGTSTEHLEQVFA